MLKSDKKILYVGLALLGAIIFRLTTKTVVFSDVGRLLHAWH